MKPRSLKVLVIIRNKAMFTWGGNLGAEISPFKILARLWSQIVSAYHYKVDVQSTQGCMEDSGL